MCFSCKKEVPQESGTNSNTSDTLSVLCLQSFISDGSSGVLLPEFQKKTHINVKLISKENSQELIEAIKQDPAKYDMVIGLDNAFAISEDIMGYFEEDLVSKFENIQSEALWDRSKKLLPYSYGYLALVYNSMQIPEAPESFGELQDPKYYNQLALCKPQSSSIGRASLLWSVALFGEQGYEQLWKSLRKNIIRTYDTWEETVKALENGSCSMIIGYSSTPVWYQENNRNNVPLKFSLLKEGSFLHVHNAAIMNSSRNKKQAEMLLQELLNPDMQQLLIFKTGLFPANSKTFIPMHFISVPFSAHHVNAKLRGDAVRERFETWMAFWDKLFSYRIVRYGTEENMNL